MGSSIHYPQREYIKSCIIKIMHKNRKELLIVVAILAIAAFFRFYDLSSIPPGLYPDEAMNGNDGLVAMEQKDVQIFYPNNNGREGLFINIQAIFVDFLGNHAWVLRMVSAIFGTLTVLGLYLLAKELFNRQIGYFSSFFLAILFWHVNFSRIGFRAIMLPFVLVYGFYFLWKGLKRGHLADFVMAGIFGGLGFHTYISYRVAPLIVVIVFLNFWLYIKKGFSHSKYEHARNQLFRGFVVFVGVAALVVLPLLFYFLTNQGTFLSRFGSQLSVFGQEQPLKELIVSVVRTLGMFNFYGDWNWRHNMAGSSQLFWPIGALFVIGFIKELIHWTKRKHGHFSTAHTFLFAWFFIMLLPGFLSTEAPHALRTIGVIPVVMIFAALGLWWAYEKLHHMFILFEKNYHQSHQKHVVLNLVLILFLMAVGIAEYHRYFNVWATNVDPALASKSGAGDPFAKNYVNIAKALNDLSVETTKYVVVNVGGVYVEIPGSPDGQQVTVPAQTVMFLTDTFTYQKQVNKNLFYITEGEYQEIKKLIPQNSYVVFLEQN